MKKKKYIIDILTALIISILPLAITEIVSKLFSVNNNKGISIIIIVISYLLCAIIVYLINLLFPKLMFLRKYRKIEGLWIEWIPNFSRHITICKLYFKNGEYHFEGKNYKNSNEAVGFKSIMISDYEEKLFYVTDITQAVDYEGFGKMKFEPFVRNNTMQGTGYFIDVKGNTPPAIVETEMMKIDKCFCNKYLKGVDFNKLNKMDYDDIYDVVKDTSYLQEKLQEVELGGII